MKVTFLGTGTSQGVPVIGCHCQVCSSTDPRDDRLRTSVLVEWDELQFVIDTGPDFRQQMLRQKVERLDAVLFTHSHKDHLAGMDDIRPFNFKTRKDMEVYATVDVQVALRREFHYVFDAIKYPGVPMVNLNTISTKRFQIGDKEIIPIEVLHHKMPVLGFRMGDFAYITDANFIAEKECAKLHGLKVLVLNALRKERHISHFSLDEAIELVQKLKPERAFFTHISHQLGLHAIENDKLPTGIHLAYDGLEVLLPS